MKGLVKAEWFKLKKSLGFKLLLLGNAVVSCALFFLYQCVMDSQYTGCYIMESSVSLAVYHAYIGYLFAAVFICKEFSNRTFSMSFLCGYSRRQVFLSKFLGFLLGFVILFCEFIGLSTILFSVGNGFGVEGSLKSVGTFLRLAGCGLAGCVTSGAVMVFVAVAAKKTMITIAAGVGFTYVICWLETTFYENPLPFVKYIFCYQIRQMRFGGETFSPGLFFTVLTVTFTASLLLAAFIFEKSELK